MAAGNGHATKTIEADTIVLPDHKTGRKIVLGQLEPELGFGLAFYNAQGLPECELLSMETGVVVGWNYGDDPALLVGFSASGKHEPCAFVTLCDGDGQRRAGIAVERDGAVYVYGLRFQWWRRRVILLRRRFPWLPKRRPPKREDDDDER